MSYNFATAIIKAYCVLHTFVADRDGLRPSDKLAIICDEFHSLQPQNDELTAANGMRDGLANYFLSSNGTLNWQLKKFSHLTYMKKNKGFTNLVLFVRSIFIVFSK